MDLVKLLRFVTEQRCKWELNPPHASHFGSVWERQIERQMAEVTGIVSARPLTAIPADVDNPQPLSPAMLTTMKTRPLALWPSTWKLLTYRFVCCSSVERSSMPGEPVLAEMASRVPPVSSVKEEMESTAEKPS